ncbi:ornithine aminomutase subunit alpha [Chloroflexota bacterium]
MYREDDYAERRKHLANLSDEELSQRFWDLSNKIVDPLLELARTHTSPAIEQSVLLRMGFSSLEVKEIVQQCQEHELLGKGTGHIVWRLAKNRETGIREAGLSLIGDEAEQNWMEVKNLF